MSGCTCVGKKGEERKHAGGGRRGESRWRKDLLIKVKAGEKSGRRGVMAGGRERRRDTTKPGEKKRTHDHRNSEERRGQRLFYE